MKAVLRHGQVALGVWRLVVAILAVESAACHSSTATLAPCPRPPFALVPALDTLVRGANRTFTPGPELSPTHGVVTWTTSDARIATVDQRGVAVALSTGTVQLRALDTGSPSNCPDQWYGTLVVR
jgi:hypothetical protein